MSNILVGTYTLNTGTIFGIMIVIKLGTAEEMSFVVSERNEIGSFNKNRSLLFVWFEDGNCL